MPGTVPTGSVHTSGLVLLQLYAPALVTATKSRPVPSVSVSTTSLVVTALTTVVVSV